MGETQDASSMRGTKTDGPISVDTHQSHQRLSLAVAHGGSPEWSQMFCLRCQVCDAHGRSYVQKRYTREEAMERRLHYTSPIQFCGCAARVMNMR